MADTRRSLLKVDLIAASLSEREYLHLRNTVKILRFSGAPLNSDQEKKVKEFEAVVAAYERIVAAHTCAASFSDLAAWPCCSTPDCPNKICVRFQNGKCWSCTMGMQPHWYDGLTVAAREQISRRTEEEYWRKQEANG